MSEVNAPTPLRACSDETERKEKKEKREKGKEKEEEEKGKAHVTEASLARINFVLQRPVPRLAADNMEEAHGGGSQGGESKILLDPEA
ncbi:hypothetical protein NL676_021429 [Syzygium grande]|nr:hypothetical protein NL676_021429 [Syzygium grande]